MEARAHIQTNEAVRLEVGKRLRERREELGLSQDALGARMLNAKGNEVKGTQVGAWERAKAFPERRYWLPLADALDTDVASLFGELAGDEGGTLSDKIVEVEEKLAALAGLLGVSDEDLDKAVRRRRRIGRSTSRLQGGGDDLLPPPSLLRDPDQADDEDSSAPPPSRRPRRSGKASVPRKGRGS